jgi:S1-C subfamily serine protease
MKSLAYLLCALALTLLGCSSVQDTFRDLNTDRSLSTHRIMSAQSVAKAAMQHTVSIEMLTRGLVYPRWVPVGTGTLVGNAQQGYAVLTAEHVAGHLHERNAQVRACSVKERENCVSLSSNFVLDADSSLPSDWAYYLITDIPEGMTPARAASRRSLEVGERVTLIGMPFGADLPWVSQGHIARVYKDTPAWAGDGGAPMYGVDAFAVEGFSGGGVFDSWGRLVGVTVALEVGRRGPEENLIHVVPVTNIPRLSL